MRRLLAAAFALLLVAGVPARAQVGPLLWADEFDSLDNWLKITGNINWGWGNGELEYYSTNNVDIADVPGEAGNHALRIIARNESGPGIVDQWGNPLNYTSGKVVSKSFVSVRHGMIETRVRVPSLDLGGWPAAWMLGTANVGWPGSGEVDLMEMGAGKAFRDLHDTHNGGNGLDNSTVDQMVGANAIWQGVSGTASLANDPTDVYDRPYYRYSPSLVNRFLIYRLYWDDTSMRFTVVDDGVEHDLYASPFVFGADASEFNAPFYFIFNMAIGGLYTDAWRLGDPSSGLPVSMPMPATMYVDYLRVYQWNSQGEVWLGPPSWQMGRYGLYTETTPVTAGLTTDVDSHVYVWESTLNAASIPPYEGANGLAWQTNGKGWFGAGIMSDQPLNLFNLGDGWVKFRIKIPANVSFKIGVIDSWGNQNYVDLPANTTKYGLVRNGDWGQAAIPISELRGTAIDLRMLSYEFVILETNGTACQFALDDIYWESAVLADVDDHPVAPRRVSLSTAPNPFTSGTELRFELTRPGPWTVTVLDVAGRRVREFQGIGRAGVNGVRWDGRDGDGRPASPGVYRYELAAEGSRTSRNLVRLP